MVSLDFAKSLLAQPIKTEDELPERDQTAYKPLYRYVLEPSRAYKQQFGDMYFLRLAKIKPYVEQVAADAFQEIIVGGETAKKVERVLDVRQGELCWVAGTVYMDMPFKPSILDDVAKDKILSVPSAVKKYIPEDDDDILAEGRGSVAIMLEDDSGRIRLVGRALRSVLLVTGCIIAVMGTENENGELEVIDIMFPDLPPQPERWQLSKPLADSNDNNSSNKNNNTNGSTEPPAKRAKIEDGDTNMENGADGTAGETTGQLHNGGKKVAIVSGLNFSGPHGATAVEKNLLLEYLLGESLAPELQREAAHISRLIIAGNSTVSPHDPEVLSSEDTVLKELAGKQDQENSQKKYGYDSSNYNPVPSQLLDEFLTELLPSMPVTMLPGVNDSANASLPQQPIHPAMFPNSRVFASALPPSSFSNSAAAAAAEPGWLDTVTNPWEGEVEGWRFLGTSGQPIEDIQKYVLSNDRLSMMEATCRWRCSVPTAPDTLWSYPFQEDDPFVLDDCPHVYFAGSQPEFGTRMITGPEGQRVRLVCVPSFAVSREVVLIDTETLEVTRVKIDK
ncbi:dna polymerase delta small subunit [Ophiostoma piceae UAMH 11346]|uniref:DNA-directed DNA polymerase n=1 Tax=Ophiostoma piceae (strain UAMH 11346) TaxID=1262450 RepID=S3CE29_OPHP1|nr:dna polymerase delta small subunit [Ophiostoma piceae UAMH 11346]